MDKTDNAVNEVLSRLKEDETQKTVKDILGRLEEKLGLIVGTQTDHTGTLKLILDSSMTHLSSISGNTAKMADSLGGMSETNKQLAEFATGKKQVPLSIFIIIVATVLVLWLSDRFARSWQEATISTSGVVFKGHMEPARTEHP